jgi:serine protease inhibitor
MNTMNINRWRVVWAGCLILGLWGCVSGVPTASTILSNKALSNEASPVAQMSEVQMSENPVDSSLVRANTRFGLKLLGQLWGKDSSKNLMISPSSVAIALSMTANGARGNTQKAMTETLELQGISLEAMNRGNAALMRSLETADPKVQLAIANSLWGKEGFTFLPDFLKQNQEFYQAEVTNLDFGSPNAVVKINDWVKQNTVGKIPRLVEELDPNQVLFLVNAVYFKGSWTKPFDPKLTSDRPFTLLNGSSKSVPMMLQRGDYRYLETEKFQAIGLPYGDGRLSLYVFLPKPPLAEFVASLTPVSWEAWTGKFLKRAGSIQLPRFKFEYGAELTEPLKAIGMATALDPAQADFSGISNERSVISQVQHKTFIEVNEAGTEAAAATSVGMARLSVPTAPPFQMVVDRPFFTAIQDNQTGTLLFLGMVVAPQ